MQIFKANVKFFIPKTKNKLLKYDDLSEITFNHDCIKNVKDDTYLKELISFVFRGFGEKTAYYLTSWSHQEGSPWEQTTLLPEFDWNDEIPDEYIFPYFQKLIKSNKDGELIL